jgi:N-acyl-D-amino-acid deacylase
MPTRRQTLLAAGATLALTQLSFADEAETPVTGEPMIAAFDEWMLAFLKQYAISGGQLAAMRGGKIVYSRGFGYADREKKEAVQPKSLFRIASVSKPITAVAILRLVQQQKLKLSDRIIDVLPIEPHLEKDAKLDERWEKITIEHCLAHTGGWDRDASYDPMFAYGRISKSLEAKLPIGTAEIIRYMRGQPLDSAPGEKYAYSNFGYCLLGRVIEKLGEPNATYETNVQREVFLPLGISAPRIGASLEEGRAEGEVRYYTPNDEKVTPSVGPHAGDEKHPVLQAYGGWNHEALDAHGGWIASCEDLVRFAAAFDDAALKSSKPLVKEELVREMFSKHATVKGSTSYGLGWVLWTPDGSKHQIADHGGALPCTAAMLMKLDGRTNVAALFNLGLDKEGNFIGRGLDLKLKAVADKAEWPM